MKKITNRIETSPKIQIWFFAIVLSTIFKDTVSFWLSTHVKLHLKQKTQFFKYLTNFISLIDINIHVLFLLNGKWYSKNAADKPWSIKEAAFTVEKLMWNTVWTQNI